MPALSTAARAAFALLFAVALGLTGSPSVAAELPPEIQVDRLMVQADREAREGQYWSALATLDRTLSLYEQHGMEIPSAFWFSYGDVAHRAGRHAAAVESVTRYLKEAGRDGDHYDAALRLLDAVEVAIAKEQAAEARAKAAAEAKIAAEKAAVSDMVVVPAGTFQMGCAIKEHELPAHETRPCRNAQPVRQVRVPSFAISKYEVTFAQWDACVSDGACPHVPDDNGRGQRPAINVSWRATQGYVAWLSGKTGDTYRLPTEAEWEYAARAGTTTKYHWGDHVGIGNARCARCAGEGIYLDRTAPVGSFAPNAFGLHDMHGNATEWVQDCVVFLREFERLIPGDLTMTYRDAPNDGSARANCRSRSRIRRGGSFVDSSWGIASWYRDFGGEGDIVSGFRVARSLTP